MLKYEMKTLSELSTDGKGHYGIAAPAVEYSESLPTYLRITDINDNGTIDYSGLKSVSNDNASDYFLKANDIVFARTGASTGRNYFYDGTGGKFVYAGFLIKFSIDEKKVNPKYVKYYCMSQLYRDWVSSFSTGSTRGNINAQTYGNMPILLPSRPQQDFLVQILSALDDKIELNNKINKNLEEQAQALYKSWFVDFEPFGRRRPTSWYMGILSDLANISTGKRPTIKSDIKTSEFCIPIVGASSVMGYTSKSNYNDRILVTGRVGTHGVIQRFSTACWASDNTLVITSNYYEYVNQILGKIDYSSLNRGSTQPLITQGDMNKEPVLIPDTEALNRFETIVGALMTSYDYNNNENMRLEEVRDTLLPKLMSGEIDVDDVEI